MLTTCSDKSACIVNLHSGEVMATGFGHSETVVKAVFVEQAKGVVTVGAI